MKKIIIILLLVLSNNIIFGNEVLYMIQPYGWQNKNHEMFSESKIALYSFLDIDEQNLFFKKNNIRFTQNDISLCFSNDRFELTIDKSYIDSNQVEITEDQYKIDISKKNVLFVLKNDLLAKYLIYKSEILFFMSKGESLYAPYDLTVLNGNTWPYEVNLNYTMFVSGVLGNFDFTETNKRSYLMGEVFGLAKSNISIDFYHPSFDFSILPIFISDKELE